MKTWQPKTLIQIHYHNRPGGVSAVMSRYAAAFADSVNDKYCVNIVVCNALRVSGISLAPAELVHVPACDYRTFLNSRAYTSALDSLTRILYSILSDKNLPLPICVIGHNLILAKNPALTSAFAHCAQRCSQQFGIARFFSVIHDFAEDGRCNRMEQLAFLEHAGVTINNDRYPPNGTIHYVGVSPGTSNVIQNAGGLCSTLLNSLANSTLPRLKDRDAQRLVCNRYAQRKRILFDSTLPLVLYPSRCIARKNIIEAVLVSALVYRSNLMLGLPGKSIIQSGIFSSLNRICIDYQLPVLFNGSKAFEPADAQEGFSPQAYACADRCMSTSINEGFGYALYEPWLHGKAIVGRKPLGFTPEANVALPGLYERLPVPAAWVSLPRIVQQYHQAMTRCFGKAMVTQLYGNAAAFARTVKKTFVKNGAIDFGCLSSSDQLVLLTMLLESAKRRNEWERLCGKELMIIRTACASTCGSTALINGNRKKIQQHLTSRAFQKNFRQCFLQQQPIASSPVDSKIIARHFCNLSRFRLLLIE